VIAKQIKGRGFRKCLGYVLGKDGARVIDASVSGAGIGSGAPLEVDRLVGRFRLYSDLNPRVKRVLYHAILSTPADEPLEDRVWTAISREYLEGMGFTMNPYIVVRHTDTDHHHVHIVAGRVRADGTCVSDAWDYSRSERLVRRLEAKYGLYSPGRSLDRFSEKRSSSFTLSELTSDAEKRERSAGEARSIATVREAIDRHDGDTLIGLVESLVSEGIGVIRYERARTGKVRGIAFSYDGHSFPGTRLGATYTWNGLTRKRGLRYTENDRPELERLTDRKMDQERREEGNRVYPNLAEIVALLAETLDRYGDDIEGRDYRLNRRGNRFTLSRVEDGTVLLRAEHVGRGKWSLVSEPRLNEGDRAHLLTDGEFREGERTPSSVGGGKASDELPPRRRGR
jgi:Relaxase/Mobilisation nuclease domain